MFYILALLSSALANTTPPTPPLISLLHTNIWKPSSWHPPPLLGRLGGTWELNLCHPSYDFSNISGVQHFTRDWWEESMSMGQKAPPGTTPLNCSAQCHYRSKVSLRKKIQTILRGRIHVNCWMTKRCIDRIYLGMKRDTKVQFFLRFWHKYFPMH